MSLHLLHKWKLSRSPPRCPQLQRRRRRDAIRPEILQTHSFSVDLLSSKGSATTAHQQCRVFTSLTHYHRRQRHGSCYSSASLSSERHDEDDNERYVDPAILERYATHSIPSQLLPRYAHYLDHDKIPSSPSRLDMELGEYFRWDDGNAAQMESDVPDQSSPSQPAANAPPQHQLTSTFNGMDLLLQFDPQNMPSTDNLHDLELWLECEAQQEHVLRYQAVLRAARDRQDYSSLSLVQRQIVAWFGPLSQAIEQTQKDYLLVRTTSNDNDAGGGGGGGMAGDADTDEDEATGPTVKKRALKRYGPFLCALPPAKLAVIASHEVLLLTLTRSGADGRTGVPFVAVAQRLGEAVEEEVLIHRMLWQRFIEQQEAARQEKEKGLDTGEGAVEKEGFVVDIEALLHGDDSHDVVDEEGATGEGDLDEGSADYIPKWVYAASHLESYLEELSASQPTAKRRRVVAYAIRKARQVLEKECAWTVADKVQVGAALFQMLLTHATVRVDGRDEAAFDYEKRWVPQQKTQSYVTLNETLYQKVVSDDLKSFGATTSRYKPMIVPPKPWTRPDQGGYAWLKADLMRYHGANTQREVLRNADLSVVFDGLDALGRVPWKINDTILQVAWQCWERDVPLGDIPSRTDHDVPAEPVPPVRPPGKFDKESQAFQEYIADKRAYREALSRHRRLKQRNMDLRSLRCSAMFKLDQAQKFGDFERIYFPYNMDFRGRAYPIPPHLSNVGSDLCRGLLQFADAKALGPRGLYWLKVHLANLAGADKMSFDDRAKFVDEHMAQVRDSVENPLSGERWWTKLDDPFQGLACCHELVNAIDSDDPASYPCALPVHMDGSCNGLQHYAALGRDRIGGKAVNLCACDEPQDVYIGVMHEVIRRVMKEAERKLDFNEEDMASLSKAQKKDLASNRAAKLVNGLIDRGVVKRTVMTSVYGVTYIGARQQIQEKIESKLEEAGYDIDVMEREIFQACGYLARVTMDVMGDLFQGAKGTMHWLTTCARMISQHGYPVAWISPIGLPAIQPYRQKKMATLVTLMQTVTLASESDDLSIHKQRQVSAFPPNYVHSLDSSHMLLTALEMDRRGLTFSAVHDSFWTHACDIDEMNVALRDVFVDLYDTPLLETLKATWELRYPDLEFPELPQRGSLDLQEVKHAKYFFQ